MGSLFVEERGTGGRTGTPCEQADITENITFLQLRWRPMTTTATNPLLEIFKNNTTVTILTHLTCLPTLSFNLGEIISCVYFSNICN